MSARLLKKIAANMERAGYSVKPNNGPGTPNYRPKTTTARKRRRPSRPLPRSRTGPLARFWGMIEQMAAVQRERNQERRQERLDRRRS